MEGNIENSVEKKSRGVITEVERGKKVRDTAVASRAHLSVTCTLVRSCTNTFTHTHTHTHTHTTEQVAGEDLVWVTGTDREV